MSISVFKMGFEGKNVFDKAISADDFADYLKKINRMVAHIAKAKNLVNEKFSIENYKLYLNNFEEGSAKAGFTFPPSHFQPETLNEFGISSKHGSYENLVINLEKVIKF